MKCARFKTGRWSRIGIPAVALVAVAVGGATALTGCASGGGQRAAASQSAAGRTASRVTGASRPVTAGSGSAAPGSLPSGQTPSSAAGTPGTSSAAAPEVAIGQFTGRAPSEIDFSADGGNVVTGLRWRSWTASGAAGHGTSGIESCVPNCAEGSVRYVPTTITLSSPVNGKFTMVTEERNGQTLTAKWPVQWPLGAS